MKAKIYLSTLALLILPASQPLKALVNPEESAMEVAPWYVELFVMDVETMEARSFCKGALIAAQWVLTADTCILDPFKVLDNNEGEVPAEDGRLFVRFGNEEGFVEADRFETGSAYTAALVHLKDPVEHAPLPLAYYAPGELEGREVAIYSNKSTTLLGDSVFNTGVDSRISCRVNGEPYYDLATGAFCYVLDARERSGFFYRLDTTAIDPEEANLADVFINSHGSYDAEGKYLYFDFAGSEQMPCHEDLGAPILLEDEQGRLEMVGIVSGVGMVMGYPSCNSGLRNYFITTRAARSFIEHSMAQSFFDTQCPSPPEFEYEYLDDNRIRLFWDRQDGALGYKLHYTRRLGFAPITTLDLGDVTEFIAAPSPLYAYTVSLSAYSAQCSSVLTKQELIFF